MKWRLIAIGLLLASPAWGQAVRVDGVGHRYADVYDDSDPLLDKKRQVDTLMGVYQTLPPRRHTSERVRFRKKRIEIAVWQPVARLSNTELKLRAVQWFVFGRNQFSSGVRGVFSEFPDVNTVLFSFNAFVRPDRKGRRLANKPDKIKPYLGMRLTRKRFNRLRLSAISGCIERQNCDRVFRSAFNDARFNRKYTAKIRAED